MPRLKLVAGVSAVALTAVCTGFVSSAGAEIAGTASFNDPAGDAEGGPDVTSVTINGDATTGLVSFTVTVPGYSQMTAADGLERYINVWVDTDKNRATGDPQDGTEVGLFAWIDAEGRWWSAERWNGSKFDGIPASPTRTFSRTADVLTWTLSTAELGGTSFSFYVFAGTWNEAETRSVTRDRAPALGMWDYDIAANSATPPPSAPPTNSVGVIVGRPNAVPTAPIAGKPFAVSFRVTLQKTQTTLVFEVATGEMREDLITTWQPLSRGTAVATPAVGGKPIRSTASIKNGVLRVSMLVPKTARGKLLRMPVKVTATDSGKTVTKSTVVSFRIK